MVSQNYRKRSAVFDNCRPKEAKYLIKLSRRAEELLRFPLNLDNGPFDLVP